MSNIFSVECLQEFKHVYDLPTEFYLVIKPEKILLCNTRMERIRGFTFHQVQKFFYKERLFVLSVRPKMFTSHEHKMIDNVDI